MRVSDALPPVAQPILRMPVLQAAPVLVSLFDAVPRRPSVVVMGDLGVFVVLLLSSPSSSALLVRPLVPRAQDQPRAEAEPRRQHEGRVPEDLHVWFVVVVVFLFLPPAGPLFVLVVVTVVVAASFGHMHGLVGMSSPVVEVVALVWPWVLAALPLLGLYV